MTNISDVRNSILNYELTKKVSTPNNQTSELNSNDIKGKGHLDADRSGEISSKELTEAAKRAGVDISQLTQEEKTQLLRELSTFSKQGGSFASSTTEPNVFSFKVTSSIDDVKSGKLNSEGKVSTLSKGDSGPAVKKLERLLSNLNYLNIGDKFGDDAEKYVRHFQINNMFTKDPTTGEMKPKAGFEDVQLGVVDSKTLKQMEISTKMENPYGVPERRNSQPRNVVTYENSTLPTPNQPQIETNTNQTETPQVNQNTSVESSTPTFSAGEFGQFERVNNNVKTQLIEAFKKEGLSPEDAEKKADESLQLGSRVTQEAIKQDKSMKSNNLCYTSVKRNLENTMDIPYKVYNGVKNGTHARTAPKTLFAENADKFVKLSVDRADVQYLPPGSIVVYHPADKTEAGHIGVQTAQLKTPAQSKSNSAQGLPITSYQMQDGKIVGVDVQVGKSNVRYEVKDGKVFDDKGKETNLVIDHADISDVQRNNPWANAKVDVFFPKDYK